VAKEPKEFMRYAALGPSFQRAWARLEKEMKLPPSAEVFLHGYARAKEVRYLTPEAYAVQAIHEGKHPGEWAKGKPPPPITTDEPNF
jgi:hypothetical protein